MSKLEERILLVDGDPDYLWTLKNTLSTYFYVLTAGSGREALDVLATRNDIAAVVVDAELTDIECAAFLSEMHVHWPEVRRLMMVEDSEQDLPIIPTDQGSVFRFFAKPCDVQQLMLALHDAIDEFRFATRDKKDREILEIQAEAGERARRAFLATMSHELLTPLNHVLGFSAILTEQWRQRGEEEAIEYLDHIRESGESLLRIVHRVLEIARMSSDHEPRKREILEVTEILSSEIEKIRDKAKKKNVSLSLHSPPEPMYVGASKYEFRLALNELLDNAVKYNCQGGHVSVSLSSTSEELFIRIVDTGIGISGTDAEASMKTFCSKPCMGQQCKKGIGLGLTLVTLFATALGGKLSIDRGRSKGSAVILSLKRSNAAEDTLQKKMSC
jgi:signal transduction histidine kinase